MVFTVESLSESCCHIQAHVTLCETMMAVSSGTVCGIQQRSFTVARQCNQPSCWSYLISPSLLPYTQLLLGRLLLCVLLLTALL